MYAVVTTGGKQYRVEAGSELTIERLAAEAGSSVTFDRVLMVGDGDTITVGTPTVAGATVSGTVLGESLGPKLVIFKFKQKVKYRRTAGHRQHLTRVRIDEISASGKTAKAEKPRRGEGRQAGEGGRQKAARRRRPPTAEGGRRRQAEARARTASAKASGRPPASRRRRPPTTSRSARASRPPPRPSPRSNRWHTRRPARPARTAATAPASDSASSAATASTSCPARSSSASAAAPSIPARTSGWAGTTRCSRRPMARSDSPTKPAARSASASRPARTSLVWPVRLTHRSTIPMKAEIHPTYHQAQVRCVGCGNTFTVGSTAETIQVEVCNKCHPVLHRHAEHRRHRRPGRAVPEASRALPALSDPSAPAPAAPGGRRISRRTSSS